MSEVMIKQDEIVLNELYLARRTAVELVRDAEQPVIDRLNHAFLNEIVTIVLRCGIDPLLEAHRLFESSEEEAARLLIGFLAEHRQTTRDPKSTVNSPATPSKI